MRPIPSGAAAFVARHEGLRLESYRCPAGAWTIGYGHTGVGVHAGMRITAEQATKFLLDDLKIAAARLEAKIGRDVVDSLTEHQYTALLSFVFNLGTGDPAKPEWKIWGVLRARAYAAVPAQMVRFVNAGGQKLQGLVNRRNAEVEVWSTEEPGSATQELPSSYTRVEPTPPTPEPTVPLSQQPSFISKAVAFVAMVLAWVGELATPLKQSADNLAGYSAAPLVQKFLPVLITFAAGCLVASMVSSWLKQKAATR